MKHLKNKTDKWLNVRLPESQLRELKLAAEEDDRTMASLIRQVIKEYLKSKGNGK